MSHLLRCLAWTLLAIAALPAAAQPRYGLSPEAYAVFSRWMTTSCLGDQEAQWRAEFSRHAAELAPAFRRALADGPTEEVARRSQRGGRPLPGVATSPPAQDRIEGIHRPFDRASGAAGVMSTTRSSASSRATSRTRSPRSESSTGRRTARCCARSPIGGRSARDRGAEALRPCLSADDLLASAGRGRDWHASIRFPASMRLRIRRIRLGPRQRSASTSRNSGASSRSVASFLNSSACLAALAQDLRRERLDRAVAVEHARRGDRPDARDAGIAVGRIADERKVVGDERRRDAELRAHARVVVDLLRAASRPARRDRRARIGRGPCRRSRSRPCRTAGSAAAMRAAEARASSASSSIIGHTATPIASSASSSGWNCAHKARSIPSPVL